MWTVCAMLTNLQKPIISWFIAELHSGPKGRRAEPHNYRARIEIKKTMRLSFHGHRWQAAWLAGACALHTNEVVQHGGHTPEKA